MARVETDSSLAWSGIHSAEVFCAKRNQLRVDFMGNGEVVEFAFPHRWTARRGRCSCSGRDVRAGQGLISRAATSTISLSLKL